MAYGTVSADIIQSSVPGVSLGAGNASIMKNRFINGAMVIDQRNAGASVTPGTGGTYTLDRWQYVNNQASKFSIQQNAGSVTPPIGFNNYIGFTSLSAYSSASSDYFVLTQSVEGFNWSDLGWGTSNAKTVTLSFQVYSSLTGTFGGSFVNSATNRSYPFTYTISSANTWTSISVTVAGDTAGTWVGANNGIGVRVYFDLGSGSTFRGTAGSWSSNYYLAPTGAVSVVGTSGATWYMTGVQLEVGSSATGFEYRQYQQELALCQRYYQRFTTNASSYTAYGSGITGSATAINRWGMNLLVPMRTKPSNSFTNSNSYNGVLGGLVTISADYSSPQAMDMDLATTGLTATSGLAVRILPQSNNTGYIEASAEL